MILKDCFRHFLFIKKIAGLSERSILDYKEFIAPFVFSVGLDTDISQVLQSDIENYIASLFERPLSRASRSTYIRHVKIFLKWCSENYSVKYDYSFIKVPKTPKKCVHIYSVSEMKTIFNSVQCGVEWVELRNKAMIALMYDSGLRQAELCSLERQWISFADKNLKVHGKGDKERIVPLGALTMRFLSDYLDKCPFMSKYVFLSVHGDSMTCNTVKLMISKLSAKLDFKLSSHKLRHNFATNYCINQYEQYHKVDIYSLMYIMGHENIETTQKYLHFAMEIIASKNCISQLDNILLE